MILISRNTTGQNSPSDVEKYFNWTEWPELCGPHPTRVEGVEHDTVPGLTVVSHQYNKRVDLRLLDVFLQQLSVVME